MILKYFRGISYKSPIFPSDTLIKLPGFLEFYRPVIESAEHIIEAIVKNTGMPWWLSISVLTVGVRIINIPFLYLQYRSTSPLAVAMPNYRLLNDIVKNSEASNTEKILISIKTFRQINKTHNIQFSKTFLYGFLQFPQFITFVWAVRSLCGHNNELKTGGTGWFTDLTEPDPYMVLPIISLSFTYFNLQRGIDDSNRNWIINRFKHFVQIWIIITLPISVHWPSVYFI
jgi:YidC/Oxa1 family membrane protein insertase